MSVLEIEEKALRLSEVEKRQLIDRLWESMGSTCEEPPAWHGDILSARLQKIESGEAKFYSLEEVQERMAARSREARLSQ